MIVSVPWGQLAMAVWLGGAAIFLGLRFAAYFRLRGQLIENAREVGRTDGLFGTIRLLETPATNAPLAFGVFEPVIALPSGFMASLDRDARDLALEHEFQHHRAGDLLINVLVQPLFALHWFNPLGYYGWLALRRDQEAACDARVLANRSREMRALYASVIASFAAGPNVALAAPMACPVLGDKSIIQRLRNLQMTEHVSNASSRKLGSRLMLGTAVLALPLTASITYAETLESQEADTAGSYSNAPPNQAIMGQSMLSDRSRFPKAPAAPNAPGVPKVPEISAAPSSGLNSWTPAPMAPAAPGSIGADQNSPASSSQKTITTIDPDTGEILEVVRMDEGVSESEAIQQAQRQGTKVVVVSDTDSTDLDGAVDRRVQTVRVMSDKEDLSEVEIEKILKEVNEEFSDEVMEELREALAEAEEAFEETRIELKVVEKALEEAGSQGAQTTVVRMSCDAGSSDVASTKQLKDGTTEVAICQSRILAQALSGLEIARKALADTPEIQGALHSEALNEIERQIEAMKKEAR